MRGHVVAAAVAAAVLLATEASPHYDEDQQKQHLLPHFITEKEKAAFQRCLEVEPWGARKSGVGTPPYSTCELSSGPSATWVARVRGAAVREAGLRAVGMQVGSTATVVRGRGRHESATSSGSVRANLDRLSDEPTS